MNIKGFEHIVRAVANSTGYFNQYLIIGSQAVLPHCLSKGYDFSFHSSMELDIAPIPDNEELSTEIDGSVGENSPFHLTHGYYAHGVGMETAIFPLYWEQRCGSVIIEAEQPVQVFYPSMEDLFISKLIASREKDVEFACKMVQEGLVDKTKTEDLLDRLPLGRISREHALQVDNMARRILDPQGKGGEDSQEAYHENQQGLQPTPR